MSLLFFLKPIWNQLHTGLSRVIGDRRHKKKVYRVTYDRKTAKTTEVDFSSLANELLKTQQHKARMRQEEDEALLFADILEII